MLLDVKPGDLLVDRYRIESVIGAGSMANVYRATDESLELATAPPTRASSSTSPSKSCGRSTSASRRS